MLHAIKNKAHETYTENMISSGGHLGAVHEFHNGTMEGNGWVLALLYALVKVASYILFSLGFPKLNKGKGKQKECQYSRASSTEQAQISDG